MGALLHAVHQLGVIVVIVGPLAVLFGALIFSPRRSS